MLKNIKIKLFFIFLFTLLSTITFSKTYSLDGNDIVGKNVKWIVQKGDTLGKIANRYSLSWHEILEANQSINAEHLQPEQELLIPLMRILPTVREGIVINLAELRLYYFPKGGREVMTYPVGLGRRGQEWRTPLGKTQVSWKKENPTWRPTKAIKEYRLKLKGERLPDAIHPGPNNPMGYFAIYLAKPHIVIHGNNEPRSVGRYVSSGCIRLHSKDIKELFQMVEKGTPVTIINETNRAGWLADKLYLKSQIPLRLEGLDEESKTFQINSARKAIHLAMKGRSVRVDWKKIKRVLLEANGIPTEIGEAIHTAMDDSGSTPGSY